MEIQTLQGYSPTLKKRNYDLVYFYMKYNFIRKIVQPGNSITR